MIIGAKRILEIVKDLDKAVLPDSSHHLVGEIRHICERWIDIQENDGNPVDASSLANTFLKKQTLWNYNLQSGLYITNLYAPSTFRASLLEQVEDNEKNNIPMDNIVERNYINIDARTAIQIADEILKNRKKDKIVVYQSSVPRYLELINSFHNIIEDQQDTIDSLVARLTQ